jgi:hypothetical protein
MDVFVYYTKQVYNIRYIQQQIPVEYIVPILKQAINGEIIFKGTALQMEGHGIDSR